MKKRYILSFLLIFSFCHTLIHLIFSWQHRQLINYYHHETSILHHNIAERFALLIDSHRAIGIVTSEYLSSGRMQSQEYADLTNSILTNFDEILGLNILNENGRIIKVSPERTNIPALGKVSQNLASLQESAKKNEPYWLSPPFQLFQGQMGFSFYMPIHKKGKILGWVAPVIAQDKFFQKFVNAKFLDTYHLNIKDNSTDRTYFATAPLPSSKVDLFENSKIIWGRKVTFISWPKIGMMIGLNELILSITLSMFMSSLGTFSIWMYDQRQRTKLRLHSLNNLLKLTVHDTSESLVSIQHQLDQMKLAQPSSQLERVGRHINYIGTLLRQIEILQKLSGKVKRKEFTRTAILPILLELTELLNEKLNEKKIILVYDPQEMSRIEVQADKWLLCHCIFGHFIRQGIRLSPPGGDIEFKHTRENGYRCFSIYHKGTHFSDELVQGKVTDEENFVAEKVVHLHLGKLSFHNTQDGGLVLIKLPIPK